MPLSAGDHLGRYEILAPFGAGGMGEVYRGRDTELERDVAIKVLPEAVAQNPDRLARFEREAKAVAKLAHPNILEIWDFGHDGDITYAVTELFDAAPHGDAASEALTPELESWASQDDVGAFWVAFCHGLLADVEGAVHWHEIAMQRGWVNYPAHCAMPFFDGIGDDPRFQKITERLKAAWEAFDA